jgi:hypothetical protein
MNGTGLGSYPMLEFEIIIGGTSGSTIIVLVVHLLGNIYFRDYETL